MTLPSREHPWNDRLVAAKHHQWLARLGSLHRLTRAWNEEVQALQSGDRADHLLTRGVGLGQRLGTKLGAEIKQNLWMLERLSSSGMQSIQPLLDDTTPDDVLGRLERTVWSVQTWMILSLREASDAERGALDAVLEQVAWKQGRQAAEEAWASARARASTGAGATPESPAAGVALRPLLLALGASLLNGGTGPEGGTSENFLVQRALAHEVHLELRTCPHRQAHVAAIAPKAAVDRLCEVHAHWMRGFAYFLNSRAGLDHVIGPRDGERCRQRWHLAS